MAGVSAVDETAAIAICAPLAVGTSALVPHSFFLFDEKKQTCLPVKHNRAGRNQDCIN